MTVIDCRYESAKSSRVSVRERTDHFPTEFNDMYEQRMVSEGRWIPLSELVQSMSDRFHETPWLRRYFGEPGLPTEQCRKPNPPLHCLGGSVTRASSYTDCGQTSCFRAGRELRS